MIGFVLSTVATAIAIIVVAQLIPQIMFGGDVPQALLLAAVVGVVNGLIRPVVKTLALPISFLTMGLAGILINAALLLGVAYLANEFLSIPFTIAGFPPDLTLEAVVWAGVGAVVLGLVTAVIGMVVPGR
jgi:putative membrane protein